MKNERIRRLMLTANEDPSIDLQYFYRLLILLLLLIIVRFIVLTLPFLS